MVSQFRVPKLCRHFSCSVNFPKSLPLQSLLKSGFSPTLKSINRLLLFLYETRRLEFLIHLFSQMNANQIKCNSQTDSILVMTLLKCHRFEEAEHFLKTEMVTASNLWRNRLWDSLVGGLCASQKGPEKALLVLRDCVKNHGTLPSSFTFFSLIHRFCSEGKMDKAIEVLELMTVGDVKYPFDNFVCSSVISGFCKRGKPELALGFYENAITSGGLKPNVVTYTSLVNALCKLGRFDEVCDLVCKMEKEGLGFDVVFYSCWIWGYIKERELMEAFRRNRKMLEKGICPDTISYTILIDGFCKLKNVEKAIGLLKKMEKDGIKPNLVTYTVIMLGFCKKGKLEEACAVLKMIEDLNIVADEFMFATLINGYSGKGEFNKVFSLLAKMEKTGIVPSIVTHNTIINGLCKLGRTSEADQVSKYIHADVITYSSLLHGYTEEENVVGILETKRRLEDAGVLMDVIMCNVLVKSLFMIGAFDDAYALYRGMSDMGLVADSATHCTMIDGYCRIGRTKEALDIFHQFKSTSSFSVACYNSIITGLCKNGMIDMAYEFFVELNEKAPYCDGKIHMMLIKTAFHEKGTTGVLDLIYKMQELEQVVYDVIGNDAIRFSCNLDLPDVANEICVMMGRKGSAITNKSYFLILKALITNGKELSARPLLCKFLKEFGLVEPMVGKIFFCYLCMADKSSALLFLDKMKELYSTVTIPFTVFKGLIKNGSVLDAYQLLMKANNNLPSMDVVDYSIIVDGLCKAGYITEALDVCNFAKKKGIGLNIVCYNSVMNGLCRQGRLIEAFRLFDSLERIGLVPTEISYATLIDALCREGCLDDALVLLERMILKGLKPNSHVYSSLINAHGKIGKTDEALKLLYDLGTRSFNPDEFTVSFAINCCCLKGDMERALELLFDFKQKGIVPDYLGFLHLIRGLCAKGRMEEARSILREMLQSQSVVELISRVDSEIESESIESSLSLLCEQGSIHEAVTILNEVASIFFPIQRWSTDFHGENKLLKHDGLEGSVGNASGSPTSPSPLSLDFEFHEVKEVDKVTEKHNSMVRESQCHDFNFYYSILCSLCSKGDLQRANLLAKEVLCNTNKV